MHIARQTADRLVLAGGSPLFRPFFLGGLGLLILGTGVLVRAAPGLPKPDGPPGAAGSPRAMAGPGTFLVIFGFFVALVPVAGRIPYRKEIVVDRSVGTLVRRNRTLVRLREETYEPGDIRAVEVEEARHVDGDPYYSLVLHLGSRDSITLDRFTDRRAADRVAALIREHLGSPHPVR